MTTSLARMLSVFDVEVLGDRRFRGFSDYSSSRTVVDGSQVLAQAIVAAAKTVPGKVVRRASGIFTRAIQGEMPLDFVVQIVGEGRTFATTLVTVSQRDRTCAVVTVMLDRPSEDVIRHPTQPPTSAPGNAIVQDMPMVGRELRLIAVADPNDPGEVGPPRIEAWLRYDEVPSRDDLARALLAHFTGHLSISTTMRAHAGVGTRMAHRTLSTGVMAIEISFHDPIAWTGWLLYDHESTAVGSGMSYVRGQIRDAAGRLIASFSQDGMIRPFDEGSNALAITESARL